MGGAAMDAIQASLELERTVNQALLDMHKSADGNNDAQTTDFLEGTFLNEQVEAIKEIADLVTKMKRAGDGLGLHIIDKSCCLKLSCRPLSRCLLTLKQ